MTAGNTLIAAAELLADAAELALDCSRVSLCHK